jgi:hypothetical protein
MQIKPNSFWQSFLRGLGRILQIFPEPLDMSEINPHYRNRYSSDKEAFEADFKVLKDDWNIVYKDIENYYEKE